MNMYQILLTKKRWLRGKNYNPFEVVFSIFLIQMLNIVFTQSNREFDCSDLHFGYVVFQLSRLCRAMGGAEKVEIEWGNHSLSNRVHEAVQTIVDFVKRDGPKGWDDPWS